MSDKYLSQSDFLTGILGTPEDLEVKGLGTVLIRALTVAEVTEIQRTNKDDTAGMMLAALRCGLVKPELSAADIDLMQQAAAGYVVTIANRIMVLSGMMDGETLGGIAWGWFLARPTDGTANLTPTQTFELFRQASVFGRPVRDMLQGGYQPLSYMEYVLWPHYRRAMARLEQQARKR